MTADCKKKTGGENGGAGGPNGDGKKPDCFICADTLWVQFSAMTLKVMTHLRTVTSNTITTMVILSMLKVLAAKVAPACRYDGRKEC